MEEIKLKNLVLLLDSDSLKSSEAKRLLAYDDNEFFEFISIGKSEKHTELIIEKNSDGAISQLVIDKSESKVKQYEEYVGFGYLDSDIKGMAEYLNIRIEDLTKLFILEALKVKDDSILLVTENKKLLNRLLWRRQFSNIPEYDVVNPKNAGRLIDLHLKKIDKFIYAPHCYMGEWLWYWMSFKSKVGNYQLPWSIAVFSKDIEISYKKELAEILDGLSGRIVDILMAVDEISLEYNKQVNNNTQAKIIYHFNYWLTLYSGVLDNLALISQIRYQIPFVNQERIGLSSNKNKEFLKLLYARNPNIKSLLMKNSNLTRLVSNPRNVVIHRERLKGVTVDNRDENFYLNMVRISESFFERITLLSKEDGNKLSSWGHYKSHNDYFLEPNRFVSRASIELFKFVNDYLETLDFKSLLNKYPEIKKRILESEQKDTATNYQKTLEVFKKMSLGF